MTRYSDLGVHDALLFEASIEHVHGKDFTPKITIILSIITTCQMAKGGWHVSTCKQR